MPFVTEELWNANERPYELIVAKWPKPEAQVDAEAKAEIEWLIALVSEVRSARTELNVPPGARVPFAATEANGITIARLEKHRESIARLARIEQNPAIGGEAQIIVGEATYVLSLAQFIDIPSEKARLSKSLADAEKDRDSLAARLANPSFTERAKPEAVDKARADHDARAAEAERLAAALERLG